MASKRELLRQEEHRSLDTRKKCAATRKQGGKCTKPAGWGTPHPGTGSCRFHGGNSPTHIRAAQASEARKAVAAYGVPVETTPEQALLDELHRTAGHVAYLSEVVGRLDPDANMTGPVGGGQGGFPEYKPSVWIQMYKSERKHLAEMATACIKAGIEERRVRIAEQTGQLLADVIRAILSDLGVADKPETPGIVRKHLVGLQGGKAESA